MGEVILKTTNLIKQYDKIRVVDQVSLTIEKGDIYGFIGENGAGKTTFMRMVSGLTFPTSGSMELFGAGSIKELSKARSRMGTIIEHPALFNNMTAMENLIVQRRYLNLRTGANEKEEMQQLLGFLDRLSAVLCLLLNFSYAEFLFEKTEYYLDCDIRLAHCRAYVWHPERTVFHGGRLI